MFKVLDRARELEKHGAYVYHLELGNPRQRPLAAVIKTAIAELRAQNVGYTSSAGLPTLRTAICKRFNGLGASWVRDANVVVSPANLIISQFLDLVCDPDDRVVLFTPAFPTYWAATAHIGLDVAAVPLVAENGHLLREEDVETALSARPRAIIVNSANNPTGAVYSEAALRHLATRCQEEGVWLLSDETYADLCYDTDFFSLVHVNLPNVVVMSSFSKVLSIPGYRTGYAIGDEDVIERLALSNSTLISCLPIFTQAGCAAGLFELDSYTLQLRQRFGSVCRKIASRINESGILKCVVSGAGYYLFIDISKTGMDDMTFCNRLLEDYHTAVTPGRSFGPAYTNYIRIAFCGEIDDVKEGVERIINMAKGEVMRVNCWPAFGTV